MEASKEKPEMLDLREIAQKIFGKKNLFLKVWVITFSISCLYILPIPRTYTSTLSLAPEMGSEGTSGTLASLANTFGVSLGNMDTNDAFYPELYPDVISTNQFIVRLFKINVKTIDNEIETDYYTYLTKHQKKTFYKIPFMWVKKQIKKLTKNKSEETQVQSNREKDPTWLSEEDNDLVEAIRDMITCNVDKKTNVITISVTDQDPLISTIMADSVRVLLQDFITSYRTSKVRVDMNHYKALTDSTQQEYQKALQAYSQYCDSHQNSILQAYLTERDKLETEVSLRLNAYTAMKTQYEAAKAKVQERTPAFTILNAASVPVKAAHPKRMLFVIAMLILSTIGTTISLFWKEIMEQLTHLK